MVPGRGYIYRHRGWQCMMKIQLLLQQMISNSIHDESLVYEMFLCSRQEAGDN